MFCSDRSNRWVPCWYSQVAILYVCDGGGTNIRPISGNIEHDNTPWPLSDGRVIYERWEYVDRSRVAFHHLWTANPDGTGQMIYYGNLHPGTLMIDAKPIPGETTSCVGCHEHRQKTPVPTETAALQSLKRAPRTVGTSASPLMKMLDGSHYDAKLMQHEQDMIRYWIESAAPYPGTYAALGTGMIGGFPKSKLETTDRQWPRSVKAAEAITRRCAGCHDASLPVPKYISDNLELILSNPDFNDVRIRMSRHLMFNLSRPKKSLILLAPLATDAGGYGLCRQRDENGHPGEPATVFADVNDPD